MSDRRRNDEKLKVAPKPFNRFSLHSATRRVRIERSERLNGLNCLNGLNL